MLIRALSAKKNEPEFMLAFRLRAYKQWQRMSHPDWPHLKIEPIDFQAISYYAAPKQKIAPNSLDEVDPELLRTYENSVFPLYEQKRLQGIAVDAVI